MNIRDFTTAKERRKALEKELSVDLKISDLSRLMSQ